MSCSCCRRRSLLLNAVAEAGSNAFVVDIVVALVGSMVVALVVDMVVDTVVDIGLVGTLARMASVVDRVLDTPFVGSTAGPGSQRGMVAD